MGKDSIPETVSFYVLLHCAMCLKCFFFSFFKLSIFLPLYPFSFGMRQMDCGTSILHISTSSDMAVQGQELLEFPLMWGSVTFHPLCWHCSMFTLIEERTRKIIIYSHDNLLLALSASTSLKQNMAISDSLVQDWISNSKCMCGKHCLFTHQLLMMNFISWVMPELRIHLHLRYLFCLNIGQPGTCIAPQRQFIKVRIQIQEDSA